MLAAVCAVWGRKPSDEMRRAGAGLLAALLALGMGGPAAAEQFEMAVFPLGGKKSDIGAGEG